MKHLVPLLHNLLLRTGLQPVVVGRRIVGGGPLGARKVC